MGGFKGANLDEKQKVELRSKLLNPEKAESVTDVEGKMAKWKEDIARLSGTSPDAFEIKDRIQPLRSIMPEVIQDYLINRGWSPDDGKATKSSSRPSRHLLRRF